MQHKEELLHNLLSILKRNPIFGDADTCGLRSLLKHGTIEHWPTKTCLLDTNRTLFTFYIVITGKLKMYNIDAANKRQLTLFLLQNHDVFDVNTLLDQQPHHMYYETLEHTTILSLPIRKLRVWMQTNPQIYATLVLYLSKRIRFLETYVSDAVLENTSTRLAKLLLTHMDTSSQNIQVINNLTHDELAQLIGTTRAVFNRHIQNFKENNIIKVKWKQIEVINLKRLKQYAFPIQNINS